jgi:transcriptional regulator with XRE-family HTH domain
MPKTIKKEDPVMAAVRKVYAASRLSLDQLGQRMGYSGDVARKATWQFLNKTSDPRVSMLRRFAEAAGIKIKSLF